MEVRDRLFEMNKVRYLQALYVMLCCNFLLYFSLVIFLFLHIIHPRKELNVSKTEISNVEVCYRCVRASFHGTNNTSNAFVII